MLLIFAPGIIKFSYLLIISLQTYVYLYPGPSAFSEWIYDLTFQTNSDATVDTEYLYRDLPPNAVYVIDILPSVPGVDDDVDNNTLTSSWIVQTAENGQYIISMIVYIIQYIGMGVGNETILFCSMHLRHVVDRLKWHACMCVVYPVDQHVT